VISHDLSPDAQVILLLCSSLGLPRNDPQALPLAIDEWNDLERRIMQSDVKTPGALLEPGSHASLGVSAALGERLQQLLGRGGQLAIELERLASLGIWVVTRAGSSYPERLRLTLGDKAPPVFFGAGDESLLSREGVAIVGSRDVDEAGSEFALLAGQKCAAAGLTVISGAAKGVDRQSMTGALEAGGTTVGVLADSLEAAIANRETRQLVMGGRVTLITQVHPRAGFTVGLAMQRNKVIYALARYVLVVASAKESGGTWAGAVANLRAGWVPLFVRAGDNVPEGNAALMRMGGIELPETSLAGIDDLKDWLEEHTQPLIARDAAPSRLRKKRKPRAKPDAQGGLFGGESRGMGQ
jgi:predicted Rossmann fold nucleotide-binding protein DprA/Smf involved in DNA uptake